jgi:hypothetical protein
MIHHCNARQARAKIDRPLLADEQRGIPYRQGRTNRSGAHSC